MELIFQVVLNGLILGLVYALVAAGLSLIFGIMNIVNFAHGEYLMLAMYLTYYLNRFSGLDPIVLLPAVSGAMFLVGWLSHRWYIVHLVRAPMLAQILGTFGLLVFLQNLALLVFGPDYHTVRTALALAQFRIGSVVLPWSKVIAGVTGGLTFLGLYWLVHRTRLGTALRAVAEDAEAAELVGIPTARMYAWTFALGIALVGVAGALLTHFFYIHPQVGTQLALIAFVIVALGGFGSISGAFFAAVAIGVGESLAGLLFPPVKYALVFLFYLVVVLLRYGHTSTEGSPA